MKATQDTVVSLHYTLTDDHGLLLDSSRGRDPLAYLHGHGHIIQGLEAALEGCEVGFSKSVQVPPANAYGEYDPKAVFEAPRDQFPPGEDIKPGMQVQAESPQGIVNFTVVSANDQAVTLDANHPLAGKTLNFEVEVLEVREATDQELAHQHVHAQGHDH